MLFYNYTSKGVPNSTALVSVGGKLPEVAYNKTIRAVITWSPPVTGNFIVYANATCDNEFPADYGTVNIASLAVSIHPSTTTELLEYGGIAAAVVVVLLVLVWWYRRRGTPRGGVSKPTTGKGGLERGSKKAEPEDDDDS